MHLLNVRRGQFVYYQNKLHQVYSVKPLFRKSVHLIRLRDYHQEIVQAREIELHRPQHLDSFVCNYKRYTLHKDRKAEVGDFILVVNPSPDYLDSHYLNAIEMVASVEKNGIISDRMNGIKHHEYWVMVPELLEDAHIIDFQRPDLAKSNELDSYDLNGIIEQEETPKIGDVYQRKSSENQTETHMVIAIQGEKVFLGGNIETTCEDLLNGTNWQFVYNVLES